MHADYTVPYAQLVLTPSFHLQREQHGFGHPRPAPVTADASRGTFAVSNDEDRRSDAWREEAHATHALPPPAGLSAACQPCDAFHMLYRKLHDTDLDNDESTDTWKDYVLNYGLSASNDQIKPDTNFIGDVQSSICNFKTDFSVDAFCHPGCEGCLSGDCELDSMLL